MQAPGLSALGRRTQAPPISWLMATALAHPEVISLAAGFTDEETLPVGEVRKLFLEILGSGKTGAAALQYGTTAGDPALRSLTMERVRALDGAAAPAALYSPDRTVLTNGSQQLLYMLTEALCDPGDIVLVEDPTYFVFLGIVQSHGLAARGIRRQKDGLDLAHLEHVLKALKGARLLPRVKLLYLVSYFQNPTGTTTSFEKKAGALRLLRDYERFAGHKLYLVEDAAYRELRFHGSGVNSALAAADAGDRVLYLGTYSKPFATGVRVGFGILPRAVLEPVLRIKGNHDFGSSNLLQHLLARALASGAYERHLRQLKRRYAAKARWMREGLEKLFPLAAEWREPAGGLYFWVRLPPGVKSGIQSRLFKTALAHQVLYVPGALCYAPDPGRRRPNHEMRLSFGAGSEANIRTGLERLGAAVSRVAN